MVVVIDSRADLAQEKIILAKLKKYHIGVLSLSVVGIILLVWAIVATALNFTSKNTEYVHLVKNAKSNVFTNAAVVSDSGFCAEIARNIMLQGGNAVDAAIAATFCNGVTMPYATGIGGGGFTIIYLKEQKKCIFLNSRETAPNAARPNMFKDDQESAQFGYTSVGVPGEIHGLWTAYQSYGSKVVPWSELVMPAARLARGFPNHQAMFDYFERIGRFADRDEISAMKNLYTNKLTGEFYKVGEIITNFALSKTLEAIATSVNPVELFYNGSMALKMVEEMEQNGGIITLKDLQNYRTHVTEALYADVAEYRMCGPPPPSSWVITQAIPRIVAEKFYDKDVHNDAEFYHRLIEAEKLAYGQRGQLGDYLFSPESLELAKNMTSREFIKQISRKVLGSSQKVEYYLQAEPAVEDHGTSHTSVVDDDGNAVAITSTINTAFGSKMLSRLGFAYNNQMDDFSTPGLTNHWGFEPSRANYIRPGRRPMSSMSPTVVFEPKTGDVKMVTGATGGSKIISATAQTIVRAVVLDQSAADIVEKPRVHNQLTPYTTLVEDWFSEKIKDKLENDYDQDISRTDENLAIVYPITRNKNGYTAATDFRRKSNNAPAGW